MKAIYQQKFVLCSAEMCDDLADEIVFGPLSCFRISNLHDEMLICI